MKILISLPLLAIASFAAAQTPRYSLSQAIDFKGHTTTVVAGEIKQFDEVLGLKDLSLHWKGLATVETNFRLGFALTYDAHTKLNLARGFQPVLDFSVGPWGTYGTGVGKFTGGLYVGAGLRF